MANNPYANKVQLANGTTIIDISDSTANASDVAKGKYFYLATGQKVQGEALISGGDTSDYIAIIDNAGGVQIDNISTNIKPTQSLNGYDRPWSGGAGKNKFDEVYPSLDATLRYRSISVPNGTYTMSTKTPLTSGSANLFFFAGNVTSGASTSANGVSEGVSRTVNTTNGYITVAYRILGGSTTYSPADYNTQIESGSSATDYEPYSNICPISGYTQANIYVNSSKTPTGANTYTVSFDSAGTVYGGELDVTNGTLTVDRAIYDMSDITDWSLGTGNQRIYKIMNELAPASSSSVVAEGLLSNRFASISADQLINENQEGVAISTGRALQFHITGLTDDPNMTLQQVNNYFANNPTQVVCKLATPQIYNLQQQQVTLLSGKNYIWSDTGDVEISISGREPTLQTKTKSYTPTIAQQTESVTADSGYDGLDTVNITVSPVSQTNLTAANIKNGTTVTISNGTSNIYSVTGTYEGGGGSSTCKTATITNSSDTATSIQFTGLSGEPKWFFVRLTSQLTRSSSYSYYYVTAVRYNGTNHNGNYYRRSNGTYYNDTTHYSHTYSNGTLTISSSASRGAAGGSFYNGGYELVYIY